MIKLQMIAVLGFAFASVSFAEVEPYTSEIPYTEVAPEEFEQFQDDYQVEGEQVPQGVYKSVASPADIDNLGLNNGDVVSDDFVARREPASDVDSDLQVLDQE